jgi:hypothetical protein
MTSVDDRLREAFDATDPTWEHRVPAALLRVEQRHRRNTIVRRTVAACAVGAAVVAGAVAVTQGGADRSAPPVTERPSRAAQPFPLDGTWTSGPVTDQDVHAAATAAGVADAADAMLGRLPARPFVVVLVVSEERNSVLVKLRSGSDEQTFDEANVAVVADRMVLHPRYAAGEDVHTWTLQDGVLRLAFVSTTEAESEGAPAEAWERLFYDTAPFTR